SSVEMLSISGKSSFARRCASSASKAFASSSLASSWLRIKEVSSVKKRIRPSNLILFVRVEILSVDIINPVTQLFDRHHYNPSAGKARNGVDGTKSVPPA